MLLCLTQCFTFTTFRISRALGKSSSGQWLYRLQTRNNERHSESNSNFMDLLAVNLFIKELKI